MVGADAVFCGGGAVFSGNECEYHAVYAVGYAQRTDGIVYQSDNFPVGDKTAVESVCGRDSHQTVVDFANAGVDVRGGIAARMVCAAGLFHTRTYLLYYHGVCFCNTRHCSGRILYACPQRQATVGICGDSLHVLQNSQYILPVATPDVGGVASNKDNGGIVVDLYTARLQRTAGRNYAMAYVLSAGCRKNNAQCTMHNAQ